MLIFINGLIIWFSKASGTNSEKNFNPEVQVLREIVSDWSSGYVRKRTSTQFKAKSQNFCFLFFSIKRVM